MPNTSLISGDMRLNCSVLTQDLIVTNRSKSKPSKAVLSLGFHGSKENSVALLLVTTANEKGGQKYRVRDNIENIFGKFVAQGKCTLRLKEPKKDVMISEADPTQLKTFVQVICSILKTGTAPELTVLKPVEKNEVQPKRIRMLIRNRSEYPALNKGFPSSLKDLVIESACGLKRIETRVIQLSNLSFLSICNQNLALIPASIYSMNLNELLLSGNKIEEFPSWSLYASKNLLGSLKKLDLSANRLGAFPDSVLKLTNLYHLNVSNNEIQCLPNFSGFSNFRELRATNNRIEVLYFSSIDFARKFRVFDVFGNQFSSSTGRRLDEGHYPDKSLFLLSANKICNMMKGTNFDVLSEFLPQTVLNFLKKCEKCVCSSFTINGHLRTVNIDMFSFCENVTSVDTNGSTSVPVQFKLCSVQCEVLLSRRILT